MGTVVGTFSTTDADPGDTHTYSLVEGTGDDDNDSFTLETDGTLKIAAVLDYETKAGYTIRVRTTDSGGLWTEEAFTITTTDVNDQPTDLSLSNSCVVENQPVGTVVGTFSTTDADPGDTHTYALVEGAGAEDNDSFTLETDGTLKTAEVFDYDTKAGYTIRVRTTDQGGLWTEQALTITIAEVNEQPTDVSLSDSTVPENQPVGTVVGTFSTTDPNSVDAHTYTLVEGTGDDDNDSFTLETDGTLKTAAVFDYETKAAYTIRVRTTDSGGLWTEKACTIRVEICLDKLLPSDGAGDDRFGVSVSIDGNYAIVGAPNDDDNGSDSGAAYIHVYEDGVWTQQQKLTASDGTYGDYFWRFGVHRRQLRHRGGIRG